MFNRPLNFALIALLATASIACTSNEITTNLELAVDAAIAIAPAVETAANLPLETQTIVSAYLAVTQTCLDTAAATLDQPNVNRPAAAAQITAACAAAVSHSPALPPGTPANVVAAVGAISQALAKFLQSIHTATPPPALALLKGAPAFGFLPANTGPDNVKPTRADRKRLARIREKLRKLQPPAK
jgi:hypothetical protein